MNKTAWLSLIVVTVALTSTSVIAGDPVSGKHEAAICTLCHGSESTSGFFFTLQLAGRNEAKLEAKALQYQSGSIFDPMMNIVMSSFDAKEISDISAYYHSLDKPAFTSPYITIKEDEDDAISLTRAVSENPTAKPSIAKKDRASRKIKAVTNDTLPIISAQRMPLPTSAETPTKPAEPATLVAQPLLNPSIAIAERPRSSSTVVPPSINSYLQPMLYSFPDTGQPQGVYFPAIAKSLSVLPNGISKSPEVSTSNSTSAQLKTLIPDQLLALLPVNDGESHWPISFKTVYPTGEKPLWVLTLKCPTEAAFGIAPPPVKIVHIVLTAAMDGINATGLLPVNLQQVCQ